LSFFKIYYLLRSEYIVELPTEPIYCEICKKKSIFFTRLTQPGGHDELIGMFTLPTPKINGQELRFHPITGMCGNCGQIKIFFKTDKIIE